MCFIYLTKLYIKSHLCAKTDLMVPNPLAPQAGIAASPNFSTDMCKLLDTIHVYTTGSAPQVPFFMCYTTLTRQKQHFSYDKLGNVTGWVGGLGKHRMNVYDVRNPPACAENSPKAGCRYPS